VYTDPGIPRHEIYWPITKATTIFKKRNRLNVIFTSEERRKSGLKDWPSCRERRKGGQLRKGNNLSHNTNSNNRASFKFNENLKNPISASFAPCAKNSS
jgi:hypothetical protein